MLARLLSHPVAVYVHGSDVDASARRLRPVLRPVPRAADEVFVLTETAASIVRNVAGPRELPVRRIVNAVAMPEESDRPPDRQPRGHPSPTRRGRLATGVTARQDLPGRAVATVSDEEFDDLVPWSGVVISHAGVGSILRMLELGKRSVVVPRRKRRSQHVDDKCRSRTCSDNEASSFPSRPAR